MLTKVIKTIQEYGMLNQGDCVIVAVSGGPDSVALLRSLAMIADRYEISLVAAHVNHRLRGACADRDESFVRDLAHSLRIDYVTTEIDHSLFRKGRSLEEFCREERYAFLEKTAAAYGATRIALGHHLQDQAETVLMHLLRGSGAEGLRGMLPIRGKIIRPLLRVTRKEVLLFLEEEGLSFMQDASNELDCYVRNRIRHHLIPLMQGSFNPQVEETLARTAEVMRLDDDYLDREVEDLLSRWGLRRDDREKEIDIPAFLQLHEALRHRMIKKLLAWTGEWEQGIGYRHVLAVAALAKGSQGSQSLDLPRRIAVRREYNRLIFSRKETPGDKSDLASHGQASADYCYTVPIPGMVQVKEAGMTLAFQVVEKPPSPSMTGRGPVAFMDYEALRFPLTIRNAKPGDRVQTLGLRGTKKLKSFFIDEKVPRRLRRNIPLVVDCDGILWIAGMRNSHRVRITEETRRVLQVEIV